MDNIVMNQEIRLHQGYQEYEINSDRNLELSFFGEESSDVFIRIAHAVNITIRTFSSGNAKISYLLWNDSDSDVVIHEHHEVVDNADVTLAYGECNKAGTVRNTYVALRSSGTKALVSSASLVNTNKKYHIEVVNYAPHTYGDMKNYAVVLGDGRLEIDAIGKIVKGAHGSESHQTSRALSFEAGQHSLILPELLIDENDVMASHAMSMGTVDEDQLYYLKSRGLSDKQCLSLISTGYLMPITQTLENEELRNKLEEEMERKIQEL